ncbi:MAG: HAD-IB family phosphatase [Candidatus Omnitrophica bacterium]|nr:HAD-IB family phosphatase [Candidatus Omnitrophota bacterium]
MKERHILISDFDGTMTKYDFYDLVCAEFPEIAGTYWHQYEEGKITHFEALRSIFAGIRADESRLLKIIEKMQIEPKLLACVADLHKSGWEITVASAGCDWYIKRLLKTAQVSINVYANPGEFYPDKGLLMRLPERSPFFSPDLGVNKVAVVRDALNRSNVVAFAGDGRPDLAPALLVPAKRRFAKSWLAQKLKEIGEDFQPFIQWSEVAQQLQKNKL